MELKSLKGKVLKDNIELWDSEVNPPRKYSSAGGVADFVITRNVASWVSQGLVEIYEEGKVIEGSTEEGAEVEVSKKEAADLIPIVNENTDIVEEKEIDAEVEAVKARRRSKRK